MAKNNLHPSVQQFKEFVKNKPELVREVRAGKVTWQELFEDWYLLGEDDPRWKSAGEGSSAGKSKDDEKKPDWISKVMKAVQNMDPNQVQGQIQNINQALGAVQGVLSQFQGSQQQKQSSGNTSPPHPFQFRKD
ncbi:YlbD family protein [Mesobacillus harenae]|uniref:YlbD family protein n=1 Tax=Mesobacillus harenae TaxID=2213203 RepID=UPI00158077FD|nr:YlbD family protein [Mesobacillus harenae]